MTELRWKDLKVDDSTRSFITRLTEATTDTEWKNLKSIIKWVEVEQETEAIILSEVWKDIGRVRERNCRSTTQNKEWVFKIKCLNGLLPTMQVLNMRKAELYSDDTCKICWQEAETQDHLAACPELQRMWCILEKEVSELLIEKAIKEKEKLETRDIQKIQDLIFGKGIQERILARIELIKGLITEQRRGSIGTIISETRKVSKFVQAILSHFQRQFFKHFWSFRCKLVTDWEKRNGITKEKKREKASKRKPRRGNNKADKENADTRTTDYKKERTKESDGKKRREKLEVLKERDKIIENWVL